MGFSYFELGMLVCFGFAWPVNIAKSIRSKTSKGKSVGFLIILLLGYFSGITHKILYSRDIVLTLYAINAVMVGIDICLYFINARRDKKYGEDN